MLEHTTYETYLRILREELMNNTLLNVTLVKEK